MSVVSVPEKTLEHWASQYLTYRYRSKATLWWPAVGEDVDVRVFPAARGKAVQLELKTTTVVGERHEVRVDLGQLREYKDRPLGQQPFYAFPRPTRPGTLVSAARRARKEVTEFAFSRSGPSWWFAEQLIVLTTEQVSSVLAGRLDSHRSRKRGHKATLVTFDLALGSPKPVVWGESVNEPGYLQWREFWTVLEGCGQPGWPQLVQLPSRLIVGEGQVAWRDLRLLLGETPEPFDAMGRFAEDYTLLSPDGYGDFREMSNLSPADQTAEAEPDDEGGQADNRVMVFLRGDALAAGQ